MVGAAYARVPCSIPTLNGPRNDAGVGDGVGGDEQRPPTNFNSNNGGGLMATATAALAVDITQYLHEFRCHQRRAAEARAVGADLRLVPLAQQPRAPDRSGSSAPPEPALQRHPGPEDDRSGSSAPPEPALQRHPGPEDDRSGSSAPPEPALQRHPGPEDDRAPVGRSITSQRSTRKRRWRSMVLRLVPLAQQPRVPDRSGSSAPPEPALQRHPGPEDDRSGSSAPPEPALQRHPGPEDDRSGSSAPPEPALQRHPGPEDDRAPVGRSITSQRSTRKRRWRSMVMSKRPATQWYDEYADSDLL
ncbi:basic salivary proline-rich protein 2-like [Anopheles cruzii]|uniref:basic salivary proline-rich protein 2-like n=1 Tax=Anopheles cruzii TaxID=68878 RepID=UPI0022EC1719|nr:basic salivary proline-rich protein 2-like [Anopheles cruzii]